MSVEAWMALWKGTLIIGLSVFFVVAIVVTFFGARDIKKLFKTLNEEHETEVEE